MSREERSTDISNETFARILERIATAMERIADYHQGPQDRDEPKTSKQAQAMVWCVSTECTDVNRIAKRFNVSPRTVRRWTQLRALLDGMKMNVAHRDRASGYVSSQGVDAYD